MEKCGIIIARGDKMSEKLETKKIYDEQKTDSEKQGSKEKKKRTVKPIRRFPYYSIEDVLKIPKLIKDNNGGNPWETNQLSIALNMGKSNLFYYMTAASRDYGFTIGTRDTPKVEMTELGRKYAYAQSHKDIQDCIKEAFFNIDLFKRVYEYYKGSEPNDDTFFKNALIAQFAIEECFHDEFIEIYRKNVLYLHSLTKDTNSTNQSEVVQNSNNIKNLEVFDKKIFVIMPFSEKTGKYPNGFFKEVLEQLIKPSAEKSGFVAETADRNGSDIIHSTIVKAITGSQIILADLTEHNPNVLFELGITIALKKPVILIKTETTGQIFDIDNTIRVFSYNQNLWPSTLKKDIPNLSNRINAVVQNIGKDKSYLDTFLGTN